MKMFAGIDGGGTRTRLALCDENGVLRTFVEGPSCSFVELGHDRARERLARLWRAAWEKIGESPSPAEALFMGMGSILARDDAQMNCELAVSLGMVLPDRVRAENDAFNALAGGLCGRPGILLISGTGSACFGRNSEGKTWRAGGWGYLLNDVGSAHALGLAAIIAATRDADRRGKPTALTKVVQEFLGIREMAEIFRRVHSDQCDRAEIASLAPQVVETAGNGDRVAQSILAENANGLVEMVVTVARELELTNRDERDDEASPGLREIPELALTGGLITNAPEFRRLFLERLAGVLPGFKLAHGGLPPVLGAVLLAFELAKGELASATFISNLRESSERIPELA